MRGLEQRRKEGEGRKLERWKEWDRERRNREEGREVKIDNINKK